MDSRYKSRIVYNSPRDRSKPGLALVLGVAVCLLAAGSIQAQEEMETCSVAAPIGSLPFSAVVDNSTATADGPAGSCNDPAATVMQNDIWYQWFAQEDCLASLTVDPADYGGLVVVYAGPDCSSLAEIACGDEPEPIFIQFSASASTGYWFQIGDWGIPGGGGMTVIDFQCLTGVGACCDTTTGACTETTALDCASMGGVYQGDGVGCTPNPCPQPLPGDNCSIANLIDGVPFAASFDNDLAIADGPPGSCNAPSAPAMQNDIWFEWRPDQDCVATLTVNPTTYGGLAAVYSGSGCDDLAELLCGDEPEPIVMSFAAPSGETFWFQIGDWGLSDGGGVTHLDLQCLGGGGACCDPITGACSETDALSCFGAGGNFQGDGTICDPNPCPQPVPGERCVEAVPIASVPFSTSFDNDLATADGPPGSCNAKNLLVMQNDVWFHWIPAEDCDATVTVDPMYNGVVVIYSGPDCSSLTETACQDSPQPMIIPLMAVGGTSYWIQVGDRGLLEGGGANTLDLTCTPAMGACCQPDGACSLVTGAECLSMGGDFQGNWTTCTPNPCPQPPANDNCANATAISDGARPFSNINALTDGPDAGSDCGFMGDTQIESDIWYCYTASCNGEATISLCGDPGPGFDTRLAVYDGCTCPPAGPPAACNEDACGRQSEVSLRVDAGSTYLIRVGGAGGAQGTGTMTISCAPDCVSPTLLSAHSVTVHSTGPSTREEFYVDLDLSNDPARRTHEPRDSGLRIFDFQFDRDLLLGVMLVTGPGNVNLGIAGLALGPGTHGPNSRGRAVLPQTLPNDAVYTLTVGGSTGPGCTTLQDVCVGALVGDFNNDGLVSSADKGELLGFIFQPITQLNAKYDLQVVGSNSGRIDVGDLGAWVGFFGASVFGDPCPTP